MGSKRWVIAAVVLGSGIVFLDATVVNVALPQIGQELPSPRLDRLEGQSYVYYGYLLTLSSLLILAGALSDFYGRRRLFAIGLAGFGITSVLCGIAPSLELLILFRVLQGAAGAILVPGSLAIITAAFEGEEQGGAFGVWAGASAATTILGPAVGGALVAYVSWRAVFLINIPLIALALWATWRYVPESRDESASGTFDWTGAGVVALAVGGLTFGTIRGEAQQWQDPVAFVALGVGATATIAFPLLMRGSDNPLVPLRLFSSRNFTVTNLSTLVIYGALYVTGQFWVLFAIGSLRYNELAVGLASIPGSLFLVFFSSRFGRLASRFGPRWFMATGPVVMALGLLWLVRIPSDSAGWRAVLADLRSFVPPRDYFTDVLPAFLVFGIGLMIMVAPLTTALMRSVPTEHSGLASAINNAISRVGPQLAGALIFVAISTTFYASLGADLPGLRESPSISPLNRPDPELGPRVAAAVRLASTESFRLAMAVAAGLCFLGGIVNALGIRNETLVEDPAAG